MCKVLRAIVPLLVGLSSSGSTDRFGSRSDSSPSRLSCSRPFRRRYREGGNPFSPTKSPDQQEISARDDGQRRCKKQIIVQPPMIIGTWPHLALTSWDVSRQKWQSHLKFRSLPK